MQESALFAYHAIYPSVKIEPTTLMHAFIKSPIELNRPFYLRFDRVRAFPKKYTALLES